MMSMGRGRGRCLQSEDVTEPMLRRPGTSPEGHPPQPPYHPHQHQQLHQPSAYSPNLQPLDVMFQGPVDDLTVYWALRNYLLKDGITSSDIDKLTNFIFSKVIVEPSNVVHIAKYVYIFSKHPEIGVMLKRKFFTNMELMFYDRDLIRNTQGMHGYRNFITFFSAVTHYTRNYKFAPFDDLINALYTLFRPLILSNEDADLKLFAICMARYSKYLKMRSSEGVPVTKFAEGDFFEVNSVLRRKMTASMSSGGRLSETGANWLMLAFETSAAAAGYDAIPESVKLHYSLILGTDIDVLSAKNELIRIPKNEAHRFLLNDIAEIVGFV